MSTLTYTHGPVPTTEPANAAVPTEHLGFWRRFFDRMIAAQQRRAEREVAAYLKRHGGLLTDGMEREISERLGGRRGVL
jgi:hypothetical protein